MTEANFGGLHGTAARMADIAPFYVMDVLARAKALEAHGRRIIHMEVGEPDFSTPEPIVEAGKRSLDQGQTHYSPALGTPEVRAAVADFYQRRYGVRVAPERIIMTPGASGALQLAIGVLVDPGDSVLLADPGYPCNRHFVRLFEGRPINIPVGAETHYQLTPELIDRYATQDTAIVMLASPSNPTGTRVPPNAMSRVIERVHALGARLIVDEIYHGLVYADDTVSPPDCATALALSDQVFVVNSFSKFFGMTGWRLGWLVAPGAFVRDLEKLAQNLFLAPPTMAQHAALAAFLPETMAILEARRREFQARRNFLLPALREIGFEISVEPEGAFYLYAGCSRFTRDSQHFALELLDRAGVAITPGLDFGTHAPERHVRFAYTTDMEALREGVDRLSRYLK